VKDFWELSSFYFETPATYDEKATKKQWKEDTAELMRELISVLETVEDFNALNSENTVKEWITAKEIGFGKVMQPFRISLVGELKGPHLFDIAEMIGKQETINRINKAITEL
jgi:glutamyl-tRNA synthetase